ncbi:benzodiazapine receptor [Klebsormidium nitens]|uniref:Benzodiazapine receptor n=1 Tax=Klebsormidium nitens TaxID=105231 RepID=A0A1Y1IIE2_KLENI|nr:benzodiazapine receptor [Klebsormidium nitens]|eukprot:GAQ89832.1 benzodiazapine receptor [Klebsormidium nitens]
MASVSCRAFSQHAISLHSSSRPSQSSVPASSSRTFCAPPKQRTLVHAHVTPSVKRLGCEFKGSGIGLGLKAEGLEGLKRGLGESAARVNMVTWNKELLFHLAVPLGGGLVASAIAAPNLKLYGDLKKPKWAPPAPLFGNVWSIIYLLIGYSAWLVYRDAGGYSVQPGLWKLYGAQLVLNWLWQPLFFNKQLLGVAFIDLALLWGTIAALIGKFSAINTLAGKALIPYLLWVTFAGALNFNLWQNNPAKDKDPKELRPKAA